MTWRMEEKAMRRERTLNLFFSEEFARKINVVRCEIEKEKFYET